MKNGFTIIEFLVVVVILGLISLLIAAFVIEARSPTFELRKDQWVCDKSEAREYTYTHMVGKVPITSTGVRDECVLWSRKD